MPRTLEFRNGRKLPVATEKELLEFANKVRVAGGANILEALIPSRPRKSHQCLIANALNFGCAIEGLDGLSFKDGSSKWQMSFPWEMGEDDRRKIINSVPGRAVRDEGKLVLLLPKHIGNAAEAFDEGIAFRSYNLTIFRSFPNYDCPGYH